jgi:hypothetical protein
MISGDGHKSGALPHLATPFPYLTGRNAMSKIWFQLCFVIQVTQSLAGRCRIVAA